MTFDQQPILNSQHGHPASRAERSRSTDRRRSGDGMQSQVEPVDATLGSAVRRLRRSIGWSQLQLAETAACAVSAVSDLERSNNGTVALLDRLSSALHGRWIGLPQGRTLVDRVAAARRQAGLSFERLAQSADVSKNAVRRLETGNARVVTLQRVLPIIAPAWGLRRPDVFRRLIGGGGERDVRYTPKSFLDGLVDVLGPVGLDPCGDPRSFVRAKRMFTETDDGLQQPWVCEQEWVWVNPPFSNAAAFVRKGVAEWRAGRASRIVFLVKAQAHGRLLHDVVHPIGDLLFLRDRIGFVRPDGEHLTEARFGVMLILLGVSKPDVRKLTQAFPCMHLKPASRSVELRAAHDQRGRS